MYRLSLAAAAILILCLCARAQAMDAQKLAQAKADEIASAGRLYHPHAKWPAKARREGVGRGATASRAVANCCYWGKRKPMAIAWSRSKSGRYYACVIYF